MNRTPIQASEASSDIINAWAKEFNTYRNRPTLRASIMRWVGPVVVLVAPPLAIVALMLVHR